LVNYFSDDGLEVCVRTVDRQIGIPLVERDPLIVHPSEGLPWEEDDSTGRDIVEPIFHLIVRDFQVYDNPC